jgi:hypothetical protein
MSWVVTWQFGRRKGESIRKRIHDRHECPEIWSTICSRAGRNDDDDVGNNNNKKSHYTPQGHYCHQALRHNRTGFVSWIALLDLKRGGRWREGGGGRETCPRYHDFALPCKFSCLDKIPVRCQLDLPRQERMHSRRSISLAADPLSEYTGSVKGVSASASATW